VLVDLDHIARFIVNANHSIMWAAVKATYGLPVAGRVLTWVHQR